MKRAINEGTVLGRPAVKRARILRELRQEIVGGKYEPGSRLPTRLEIQERFDISMETVQRVIDDLRKDGFVLSRGSLGTFVAEYPPHLFCYALVFPYHPGNKVPQSRFWTAMQQAAIGFSKADPRKISFYYGHEVFYWKDDYSRLVKDLSRDKIAGILFSSRSPALQDTPVMDQPGIPRVIVEHNYPNFTCPSIYPDFHSFFDRAAERLLALGRRRVGAITMAMHSHELDSIGAIWNKRGLSLPAHHALSVGSDGKWGANHLTQLLVSRRDSDPIDGLVVSDDNLVEPVSAGLQAAGVRVPEDMDVVVHCNYPSPPPCPLPVHRLGFDAAELIARSVELLELQRQGSPVPPQTLLPALFESELKSH